MSNSLFAFLKNALVDATPTIGGVSFVKGAVTITGIYNQGTFESEATFGGAIDDKNCTLLVSAADLVGKTVVKGDIWTNDGQKWRVSRIDKGEVCSTFYFVGAQ